MNELIDMDGLKRAMAAELVSVLKVHGVEVSDGDFAVTDDGIEAPHWIKYIESGTAPTDTKEQRAAIALSMLESGWNKRKGIGDDDVWAVATSISKHGSKTYQKGGDYFIDDAISKWLDNNLEKFVLNEKTEL